MALAIFSPYAEKPSAIRRIGPPGDLHDDEGVRSRQEADSVNGKRMGPAAGRLARFEETRNPGVLSPPWTPGIHRPPLEAGRFGLPGFFAVCPRLRGRLARCEDAQRLVEFRLAQVVPELLPMNPAVNAF